MWTAKLDNLEGTRQRAGDQTIEQSATSWTGVTVRVDPIDRIDEIIAYVENARSVPMSRNAMVDRGELIALLEQVRNMMPGEMRKAVALLNDRDEILDAGRREAERIIAEGEAEHSRLVSGS